MTLLGKDLADLLQVSPQRISTLKRQNLIVPGADGLYDTNHPTNRAYVQQHFNREWTAANKAVRQAEGEDTETGLEAEKMRAEIEYKKKQSRKLDLQHEIEKKDLVPIEVIALWIGYFAAGIRDNFLTLGKRVSRGDDELQKRIDRQVTKSIEKTINGAKQQLRKEAAQIASQMEVDE